MARLQKFPLLNGKEMKELRNSLGISHSVLSKMTGVSCVDISMMENSKRILSQFKFDRLYNFLMGIKKEKSAQ